MEKFLSQPNNNLNEQPKKKNNYLRNLKMATAVSLGIMATEGKAQVTQQDILSFKDTIVVSNQESINAVKDIDNILSSAYLGDKISAYSDAVDKIISQNIKIDVVQVGYIFDELILKFMKLPENAKLVDQISKINLRLTDFLYKEKSPFNLDESLSKIVNLEKNIDASLSDMDSRILFNHVLNEKFGKLYSTKDSLISRKDKDGNIVMGRFDFSNKEETVKVSLFVENSVLFKKGPNKPYIKVFSVSVIKNNKYYCYLYDLENGQQEGGIYSTPKVIKEMFDEIILK